MVFVSFTTNTHFYKCRHNSAVFDWIEEWSWNSLINAPGSADTVNITDWIRWKIEVYHLIQLLIPGKSNNDTLIFKLTWSISFMSIPRAQTSVATRIGAYFVRKCLIASSRCSWSRSLKWNSFKPVTVKSRFIQKVWKSNIQFQ